MNSCKQEQARQWVNSYTAVGVGIVLATVIPGSTSVALCAMEAHMCYKVGKIYRGDDYSLEEAAAVAKTIGLVAIAGKMIALEALSLAPGLGSIAKAAVAGGVIKTLGEAIIKYYEKQESELEMAAPARPIELCPPPIQSQPPLLLAANSTSSDPASVEERLRRLGDLLNRGLISQNEFVTRRERILNDI